MTTVTATRDKAFRIVQHVNRSGSESWRVSGHQNGKRIRENYPSRARAEARRLELDIARLGSKGTDTLQATWLNSEQLKTAELIFSRHPEPTDVVKAISWWEGVGAKQEALTAHAKGLTLDQVADRFREWLAGTPTLRATSKANLAGRLKIFVSEVGDIAMATITAEVVEAWLDKRPVSAVTKSNDLRAVSRFFHWCCERKQRFISSNPCANVAVELGERPPPQVYTLDEVERLLSAARTFRDGEFLKFIVLGLFGGLRQAEAARFTDEWVKDGVITVPALATKTGRGRSFPVDPVLAAWLRVAGAGPVRNSGSNSRAWAELKTKAELKAWIADGLRHTSVSYFFRRSGSYGLTAERHGNSESIIKRFYQGRVSIAESEKFWNLYPDARDGKATKAKGGQE